MNGDNTDRGGPPVERLDLAQFRETLRAAARSLSFSTMPAAIQFSCAMSIDCAEHFWPEKA